MYLAQAPMWIISAGFEAFTLIAGKIKKGTLKLR